ncbi:hypothetical protein CAMSH0001_1090 [Campylobacter showae RM3277]|uniref:Uncharacterized protein n=1 Tax=Campylobacter showae RM3277 TaxID=553219 RepID=C6RHY0_9BACT|nr:hypothetical protein CAMSH0001_1090 [Campylobacter showae RM3277]
MVANLKRKFSAIRFISPLAKSRAGELNLKRQIWKFGKIQTLEKAM